MQSIHKYQRRVHPTYHFKFASKNDYNNKPIIINHIPPTILAVNNYLTIKSPYMKNLNQPTSTGKDVSRFLSTFKCVNL